jgi:hypothetical protein
MYLKENNVAIYFFPPKVGRDPECIESALSSGAIRGEANLVRFFCRHFDLIGYEKSDDAFEAAKVTFSELQF